MTTASSRGIANNSKGIATKASPKPALHLTRLAIKIENVIQNNMIKE